jgi:hypothetical protein
MAPKRTDMVVDFCAGAGGKTLLLGAMMRSQGRLYVFDIVDKRLANLKQRLKRSGLSNVHPQLLASERDTKVKRLAGKIDRVLVDAPCTGFGTLRRNPDLKWRQTENGLAELTTKQRKILAAAATLVKPGGRLVYATCSVLPDENEAIIDAFLAENPASRQPTHPPSSPAPASRFRAHLKLYPHRHGCDGFFAAVLVRNPARQLAAGPPQGGDVPRRDRAQREGATNFAKLGCSPLSYAPSSQRWTRRPAGVTRRSDCLLAIGWLLERRVWWKSAWVSRHSGGCGQRHACCFRSTLVLLLITRAIFSWSAPRSSLRLRCRSPLRWQ